MIRLALYQPDIPQNTGTLLRLGSCLNIPIEIIQPAAFALTNRNMARAGLDYMDRAVLRQHRDFQDFRNSITAAARMILLTTKASRAHTDVAYAAGDVLLLGRESSGVPEHVREAADLAVRIPMAHGNRSLNVAIAGAIVVGEALRQLGAFPQTAAQSTEH
ncbi:MAG: tRNA (cytidine(34)-2'-O)-methyltransferase [Pseudomonadota bacterium]